MYFFYSYLPPILIWDFSKIVVFDLTRKIIFYFIYFCLGYTPYFIFGHLSICCIIKLWFSVVRDEIESHLEGVGNQISMRCKFIFMLYISHFFIYAILNRKKNSPFLIHWRTTAEQVLMKGNGRTSNPYTSILLCYLKIIDIEIVTSLW